MNPRSTAATSVSIEVGGTFTDLVFRQGERTLTHKLPSTPHDPAVAALDGFDQLLERAACPAAQVDALLHGSTIAANTLIQRRGARTAFITTRGFRDLLFVQRADRTSIYDPFYRKPAALVPREHCVEVSERLAADGSIVTALDLDDAAETVRRLVTAEGIESIAICLLHAYVNAEHETALAALIRARHPGVFVTLSSEVSPEHREYERASTTVIDAYLKPALDRYLRSFADGLRQRGFAGTPLIMLSAGGVVPVDKARELPAAMFLSGPAAAAAGAALIARATGVRDVISIDVGGTSSDVCLINDGVTQTTVKGTAEFSVDGLPLNLMMTDVVSIGAGGGSIASVDAGGMLQVGPQSAGAVPGPACYGRGGTAFTLSDAMLLLGVLDPQAVLPGGIRLDREAAIRAAAPLARGLGITPAELAGNVYRIATANMAQAVRRVSIKRGYDPRRYALLAGGGVGALIGCALAEEIGIDRIVVPQHPGIFSAFGLSVADLRTDQVRSGPAIRCRSIGADALEGWLSQLRSRADDELRRFDLDPDSAELRFTFDARYEGQGYELRVPIDRPAGCSGKELAAGFHDVHRASYGHAFPEQEVEILALRLGTFLRREHRLLGYEPIAAGDDAQRREVLIGGRPADCPVLARDRLRPGVAVGGPCFVVEQTTATLVLPGWQLVLDETGVLRLDRGAAAKDPT
ncbi:MAG: hydantoinase/oxoprolinase family protein [Lautropia sp.]